MTRASRPRLLVSLLAGTIALAGAPRLLAQSDASFAALRAAYDLAVAEADGPPSGRTLSRFDEIVTALESERRQGTLSDAGRRLLVNAHENRGRLQLALGRVEAASDSFRALITLDPEHNPDPALVPARAVELYRKVKSQMVGAIAVQSVPQQAAVLLNGQGLSVTDFLPIDVLAGDYTLEVSRKGYRTENRPITITAGETLNLQIDLVRVSATGYVITEPSEVEVVMDGVSRGATTGALDPAFTAVAAARGLDPAKSSARLEIPDLPSGSHTLEFRKACYESVTMTIDVPEPQDYDIPPVRLEPSVGTLNVTSEPPGGQILVDGEALGVAPKTLRGVCAGVRRVEVRETAGRFVQDVTLAPRAVIDIAARVRPTLAFLGVLGGPERTRSLLDSRIARLASELKGLNFLRADNAALKQALAAERLQLEDLVPPARPDASRVRRFFERLGSSMEAHGFLVARLSDDPGTPAALHLLAAGSAIPDSTPIGVDAMAAFEDYFRKLDRTVSPQAPHSGLLAVDTLTHEGPVVTRVVPDSPAARAGLAPGDVVLAIDGVKVTRASEIEAAVARAGAAKALRLSVASVSSATTEPRTVELTPRNGPREVTAKTEPVFWNRVSMDLRQAIEGAPGSPNAALARLNLGLIALAQGDASGAHDAFVKAKSELADGPGLGRGTAAFYTGVSLERLGDIRGAIDELTAASLDAAATLLGPDGPRVKDLARHRAAALAGSR